MPSLTQDLIDAVQSPLRLVRAVETGTHLGDGARLLAGSFAEVVTVELAPDFARRATEALRDLPHVRVVQGHSAQVLAELASDVPTLWFLDGHWSGGLTAGQDDECPVMDELAAIGAGHPDDVVVVDDARLFTAPPPPPHDPAHWPTLMAVIDALRDRWPDHHITLLDDQLLAVPARAKEAIDAYGQRLGHSAAREPAAGGPLAALCSLLESRRRSG